MLLITALKKIYRFLRHNVRTEFNRDLPFQELLNNRWERAKELGFGEGTSIYEESYVFGTVKVGKRTWVGPGTVLDGSGRLEIGDCCSVSAGVHIYTHDSVEWAISDGRAEYDRAPVKIGNGCYIGPHSVIAKGVTIGDHCVVGALSFVDQDVPSYTKVAGCPARKIGEVDRPPEEKK